jgi:tRNA pseudouridine38-40 synthase
MPRYKITVEYCGTGLVGWQRQCNGLSVQEILENAIHQFSNESPITYAAGRTDAGVHALAQVCHFDLAKDHEPFAVVRAINHFLKPHQVAVLDCIYAPEDFHARFSAKARHYLYRINNRKAQMALDQERVWHFRHELNVDAMQEASEYLIGQHDFTSFRATSCQAKSPLKTLSQLDIKRHNDEIHFVLSAPSFLHHMVRNIVGTMVLVGIGKWKPFDIAKALEAKQRGSAGITAPACGLYFVRVDY